MTEPPPTVLQNAVIQWGDNGQPVSAEFSDVYFSCASGIEETRYVFLEKNGLPQRWQQSGEPCFTIGETGFGTGLNFLAAAQCWLQYRQAGTLHFISVEKYPLAKADLQQALSLWPELAELSNELIDQYPPAVAGVHQLHLANNRVVLTLMYGEASEMFGSLKGSNHPLFQRQGNPVIDAWFLDGFAPAKNPAMWTDRLFQVIADLSQPGTSFSTFTAAGVVRRSLQEVGFEVNKVTGFGHKRDMICGQLAEPRLAESSEHDWQPASFNSPHQPPWYLTAKSTRPASALVMGGGIAGCTTARALAERGIPVTLIERHPQLGQEGSGNPQGILYPKLSTEDSPLTRFGLTALLHASRYHSAFLDNPETGSRCGVLVLPESDSDRDRFATIASRFPGELVQLLKSSELHRVAGLTLANDFGLFFPQLGWIKPPAACKTLAEHPLITTLVAEVADIQHQQDCWQALDDANNCLASAEAMVIACGFGSKTFGQTHHLPLKQIRGQISCLPATEPSAQLKTVLCGEGYMAPAFQGQHTLGATYNIGETTTATRPKDHQKNLQQLAATDQTMADRLGQVDIETLSGRAAFRCTTPDYLPIAGPAPILDSYLKDYELLRKNAKSHIPVAGKHWPGLYLNCGHGSRGLSYAPLCSELIASQICGEAPPLELDLRQAIHPGRFLIRNLKRKKI